MTDEDRAELTEALNAVTNDQVLITSRHRHHAGDRPLPAGARRPGR